jgi:N-acetylmuramoyl-L-alanine amidase
VALQAGHWKAQEAPDELEGLRDNGGTHGGGRNEWEVNLEIAELTAELLRADGYEVEVLPATVPQRYVADAFVAIHADGNNDPSVHGYRVAAPRRDQTRRAQEFANVLAAAYGEETGVRHIRTVTRRMQGYYAFNSRRYRHSIHPQTVGVIIETGFLTSPVDQRVLVGDPGRSAQGIYQGVVQFLGPAIPEAAPIIARNE